MTYLSKEKNRFFEGDGSRNEAGENLEEFLIKYDPLAYKNPSCTVDTAVFTFDENRAHLKILLIRRKNHPSIGQWAIPGGFVEFDEDIEDAARRELEEETGVAGIVPVQVKTYGNPERDPRTRIITTLFVALVQETSIKPAAGDDARDAGLFDISLLDLGNNRYRLKLELAGKDISLTAVLKRTVTESGITPVIRHELTESDGIGMDHAVLIADAYTYLLDKIIADN